MLTDSTAKIISRHDYLPFGEEIPSGAALSRDNTWDSSNNLNQRFTGQLRDNDTSATPQLDYFNARYLAASLGRFNSPDPGNAGADLMNPQSWNGYAYTVNNPLAMVDPSGMDSKKSCDPNNFLVGCSPPDPSKNLAGYSAYISWQMWGGGEGDLVSGIDPFEFVHIGVDAEGTSLTNFTAFSSSAAALFSNQLGAGVSAPSQPQKAGKTLTYTGTARVLKGNPAQIGSPGGWDAPNVKPHILVTKNGAAIVPSQWGVTNKTASRPYLNLIKGIFPSANASFTGVSEIIGGAPDRKYPNLPVQQGLMAHYPGDLIIELPGGNDLGQTAVTITAPAAVGCPAGTTQVP